MAAESVAAKVQMLLAEHVLPNSSRSATRGACHEAPPGPRIDDPDALTFYADKMVGPYFPAIDAVGNIWVPGYANNTLTEFDPTGSILSGKNGFTGGGLNLPYSIAIDSHDNPWVINFGPVNASTVSKFSTTGAALVSSPFACDTQCFFPAFDAGQIQLHVRAPAATRIEETERIFQSIEDRIRQIIPEKDRGQIVDNIGLPARLYNLAFSDGSTIGVNDGVILVSLNDGHAPTADYVRELRRILPAEFSESTFYFQAADMVTQILNFGLPAQINVRTVGYDRQKNLQIAQELQRRMASIPGIADAHLQQEMFAPAMYASIDRARATEFGLTASQIATNLNVSLSSSEQVTPNFWTDPKNGIPYYIAVQTPEHRVHSVNDLTNTPLGAVATPPSGPNPMLLGNVATLARASTPTNTNQANIQPVYEVYAAAQDRDLGSISRDIDKIVADFRPQLAPGNSIEVIGQIESMNNAFRNLGIGLLFAAVFVYLLMVVNYQDFGTPVVVILALPMTMCGIVTMLFITGTTLSVPSLMGSIMAVGVASANSILLVTFAREQQLAGKSAFDAAVSAGHTRIRPVLMTAAAMIMGMVPMAIGGAGEEQNAALARAVIGGLLFATPTTLLVVPYLFAVLRKRNDGKTAHGVFEETP